MYETLNQLIVSNARALQELFLNYGIDERATQANILLAIEEEGEPFAEDLAQVIGYDEVLEFGGKRKKKKAKKNRASQESYDDSSTGRSGQGFDKATKAMDIMGSLFSGVSSFTQGMKNQGQQVANPNPYQQAAVAPAIVKENQAENQKTMIIAIVAFVLLLLIGVTAFVVSKK